MAKKHQGSDFDDDITAPTRPIGRDVDLSPAAVGDERVEEVAHLIVNEGVAENFDAGLHLAGTYIDNPDAIVDNSVSRPALAGTEYGHGGRTASLPTGDDDNVVSEHSQTGRPDLALDHDRLHDVAGLEVVNDDPPFDVGPAPDNRIDFHPLDIDRGADLVDDGGPVPHDQGDLGDFDA